MTKKNMNEMILDIQEENKKLFESQEKTRESFLNFMIKCNKLLTDCINYDSNVAVIINGEYWYLCTHQETIKVYTNGEYSDDDPYYNDLQYLEIEEIEDVIKELPKFFNELLHHLKNKKERSNKLEKQLNNILSCFDKIEG